MSSPPIGSPEPKSSVGSPSLLDGSPIAPSPKPFPQTVFLKSSPSGKIIPPKRKYDKDGNQISASRLTFNLPCGNMTRMGIR